MDQSNSLEKKLDQLSHALEQSEIKEYVNLLHRPSRFIGMNLLAGIVRGVGIALGFTVFMVLLLYFLRALGALNIPYVGEYIADVIKIVQHQLDVGRSGY
jgi:hypothetical protein